MVVEGEKSVGGMVGGGREGEREARGDKANVVMVTFGEIWVKTIKE